MAVSWGTRKALGRRYGIDPAQQFEADRLANEWALAPGREARALQAGQFEKELALRSEANEQAGKAGMIGTAANVGLTTAILEGQGFFGGAKVAGFAPTGGSVFAPGVTHGAIDAAGGFTTTAAPAMGEGVAATAFGAGPIAGSAAAGYVGGKAGQKIGEAVNLGGQKERGAIGGAVAGAATGAALTAWSGPGAVIGAAIGAVVGFATSDTWICTAIDTLMGLSPDAQKALSELRRYSIRNHKEESRKYYKNGWKLVEAINRNSQSHPWDIYEGLKKTLVGKCIELVNQNLLEAAYEHYKTVTEDLCTQYGVDLSIKEGE